MLQKIFCQYGAYFALASAFGLMPGAVPQAGAGQPPAPLVAERASVQLPGSWFDEFSGSSDLVRRERGDVGDDHFTVALRVSPCYREINDPSVWSPAVRTLLLIKPAQNLILARASTGQQTQGEKLPSIHPFHTAAIAFSDRVSRDRMEFRRAFEDNREASSRCQYLLIGLGALATILVSMRAVVEGTARWPTVMSASAIIVSALVTAVSSVNSSAGYTAVALRDQRALSQLQQLHWRIASDVMQRPVLCGKPAVDAETKEAMEVVIAWRSRLEHILDAATESIAKPGDISGGVGPAKTDERKAPTANPVLEQHNSAEGVPHREEKAG